MAGRDKRGFSVVPSAVQGYCAFCVAVAKTRTRSRMARGEVYDSPDAVESIRNWIRDGDWTGLDWIGLGT